ncbi:NAD-dependent epimerase/dehydratase family protein [Terracoccus luteus]|uniref:Nucleoside-diphosphate-sugar epimerase n=1 Tax=Terracoccus luteus TaxID=53356 RepID=A0A839Q4Q2_9MICO|nr:NAD-dependent epimerase/dehydratase family protein [Terracoccus luteus]MBB2988152.1 nucleoside-diphosphate-sugar epimerase [Terracoccus luteus]MCP2173787.1 nucleoside-diphosphate-sugar epimerase [Terracoccus luteus]
MRVLVTGASGLLGGRTATALADRGDDVTVLQRRASGLGLREVRGDVTDRDTVARAAEGHDAVVHLAAKVDVTGRWSDYERVNVGGTAAVVAACRAAGVRRLVHVSSPSVAHAGESLVGVGAGPADPATARGHYARSKGLAEQVALGADGDGLAVVAVRPHLVWGPGDTQLVARLVDRARSGRLPVVGTGAALIDSTYVTNAVEALVAAVDRCESAHGRAVVVSNGEPRPVAELVADICRAAGAPAPHRRVPTVAALTAGAVAEGWVAARGAVQRLTGRPPAATDPPLTRFVVEQLTTAHWFDQRETRTLLGWTPRVSVEQGLAELAASLR